MQQFVISGLKSDANIGPKLELVTNLFVIKLL